MRTPGRPLLLRGCTAAAVTALVAGLAVGGALPARAAPSGGATAATAPTERAAPEKAVPASVVPQLRWRPCGPGLEAFECTTARVPRDHDRPTGATTTLALTRLPASDPSRRIGTLFTNPGGPGGSGVDFVQNGGQTLYPPQVRARFDILGFDPRGVARSDPATCFPTAAEETAFTATVLAFPRTTAEERRYRQESRQLGRACAATSPERFAHLSTANVARDLDLLRRAVGDRRLSYAGYSYGTYLGATYARLFPGRIRALVLDGTIDPREYTGRAARSRALPLGNRIEQDRGGAEVFAEFLRRCEAAGPQACSLAALGDPAVVARQVLDRLQTRPVTLTLPDGTAVPVTYQTAVALTFTSLYQPAGWRDLADLLALLAGGQATPGRPVPSGVAALVQSARPGRQDYPSFGGNLSICVDTPTPTPALYPLVADARDRRFPDFGRYRTWVDLPCSSLKAAGIRDADAYTGPWRQPTEAQVLVLGTRWDPATPYRNTRPYADLFRRAPVVTLEGWGHTTLGQSRCADARVAAYLLHPQRRLGDLTCATDVVPFAPAASPASEERAAARAASLGTASWR